MRSVLTMIGILIAAGGLGHLASEAFVPSVERARDSYARSAANTSSKATTTARIEIEPAELDFGERQVGTSATATLTIHNRGVEPVKVADIVSSCGCTTSKAPQEPIKPGDSAEVEVRMSVGTKPGRTTSKTLTVVFDEKSVEPIRVPVRIASTRIIALEPSAIALDDETTWTIRVQSADGIPFSIRAAAPDVFDSPSETPASEQLLVLNREKLDKAGRFRTIRLHLDHPAAAEATLAVTGSFRSASQNPVASASNHTSTGALRLKVTPHRIDFGEKTAGSYAEREVVIHGRFDHTEQPAVTFRSTSGAIEIVSARSDGEALHLRLRLTSDPDDSGYINGQVRIDYAGSFAIAGARAIVHSPHNIHPDREMVP